jgi:hypothetical protein
MFLEEGSADEPNRRASQKPLALTNSTPETVSTQVVAIAEVDYVSILQWEDDGGNPVDIIYEVLSTN